jgi:hypothetical protein
MLYSKDAQKLVMLAMHEAKSAGNSKPRVSGGLDAMLGAPEEQCGDAETARRRDAALLRALSTPHKKQKEMKVGREAKSSLSPKKRGRPRIGIV